MEKRSKIKAINGGFELPETLIQHIQSFLTGKEASVLSKSWYAAWLTRPNLDLAQLDFEKTHSYRRNIETTYDGFTEFANETLQRYDDLNLKIKSFKLCTCHWSVKSLGSDLVLKAIRLGATDVEFIQKYYRVCLLPLEVFASENLVSLSVEGCNIGPGTIDGKVKCSKLKWLNLCRVETNGDIISSCPLIEILFVSQCTCFLQVEAFDVFTRKMTRNLPPSPFIGLGKQSVAAYEFRNLKCMVLNTVRLDTSFFCDFSSKFPCLKDLSVHGCAGYKQVEICSRSLECISFRHDKVLKAKFDLPSLLKFSFWGRVLPVLSFENSLSPWESNIFIWCLERPGTSFFIRLRKFLAKLSMFRVSLAMGFWSFAEKGYDYARDIKGLPKPTVESLEVTVWKGSDVCCAHLDALIWSCRPKYLTQVRSTDSLYDMAKTDMLVLTCKTLVQEVSENCYIPNRNMRGLNDLKEVNVEFFEEDVSDWRPLPWTTLLDALANSENNQEIRFHLKWE